MLALNAKRTTHFFLIAVLLFGCSIFISCSNEHRSTSSLPNIILIFADDLGYGDLGIYGHPTIKTPRLDQMAQEGAKLTSFYVSTSVCTPSRSALLTGRYPIHTGVIHNFGPDSEGGLPAEEETMAELLKARGYRTKAIGKWHLGAVPGFMPTDNGFDEYFGILYSNDMMPPWVKTRRPLQLYRNNDPTDELPVDQSTLTQRYTDEALEFIERAEDDPFFIYLPYAMPHLPIDASPRFRGKSAGGLFGDVIEEMDYHVGRILDKLEELGIDEHTMVIFTSDNGPWRNMPPRMYNTEPVEKWHAGTAGALSGSKATSYEGGYRVPCIIRWPEHIPDGQVISELLTTMDILPTLVGLTDANFPSKPLDGKNIWAVLTEEAASPHEYFYYVRGRYLEAVRDAEWKLIISPTLRTLESPELVNKELPVACELYHLSNDPYEYWDVADIRPKELQRLLTKMEVFANETGALIPENLCIPQ